MSDALSDSKSRFRWHYAVAFASYLLLTPLMTWPLVTSIGIRIPGGSFDSAEHLWIFNWLKQTVLSGPPSLYADTVFHPIGVSLLNSNIAWINGSIWFVLQLFVGENAAYSLMFLLIFPLNGIALYWLANEIVADKRAAFLAGLIGAFWPHALSHQDHPNLILFCFVPLAIGFLRRSMLIGGRRNMVLAALFLALVGYTRWQLLAMTALLLAVFVVMLFLTEAATRNWMVLKRLVGITLLSALLVSPGLLPPLIYQLTRPNPADFVIAQQWHSDLLAYLVPSHYHLLWGNLVRPMSESFSYYSFTPFIGYTALILIIVGCLLAWRRQLVWLVCGMMIVLFALGTTVEVNGIPIVSLPTHLIPNSFFWRFIRDPERINILLAIPVGLLAGGGVEVRLVNFPRRQSSLVLLSALLVCLECTTAFSTFKATSPAWYTELAAEEGDFAIVDLANTAMKQTLLFQRTHGKHLMQGRVSRIPRESLALFDASPLLDMTRTAVEIDVSGPYVSNDLQQLADAGVRYIVIHKYRYASDLVDTWRAWYPGEAVHEDEELLVLATDLMLAADALVYPFGDSGIGAMRSTIDASTSAQESWLNVSILLVAEAVPQQDFALCVDLAGPTGEVRAVCQAAVLATSQWDRHEFVREFVQFQMDAFWAEGLYRVVYVLLDVDGDVVGRWESGETIAHSAIERLFERPEVETVLDYTWEDGISLAGVDATLSAETLTLDLLWNPQTRVDKAYSVFIHMLDAQSGELVAQQDGAPRNWQYRTNWWEAGEFVWDRREVSLEGVAAGDYVVMVGLYDPETGGRLFSAELDSHHLLDITIP